jgi:hypothetical protein
MASLERLPTLGRAATRHRSLAMYEFQKHLEAARRELLLAQKCLKAEIAAYPSPISGCDAQFNHLLAERAKICQAIEALNADIFVPTSRQPMYPHELSQQ